MKNFELLTSVKSQAKILKCIWCCCCCWSSNGICMLPFWPIFLINLVGKHNQQCRRKNYLFCGTLVSTYYSQKSQVFKKKWVHVFMVPGRSQALSTSSATPEKTIKEWLPSFSKPSSLITPFTCQLCVYCQSNFIHTLGQLEK